MTVGYAYLLLRLLSVSISSSDVMLIFQTGIAGCVRASFTPKYTRISMLISELQGPCRTFRGSLCTQSNILVLACGLLCSKHFSHRILVLQNVVYVTILDLQGPCADMEDAISCMPSRHTSMCVRMESFFSSVINEERKKSSTPRT
jgi:hypothetical protein